MINRGFLGGLIVVCGLLSGCAGLTEFDKHILSYHKLQEDQYFDCMKTANRNNEIIRCVQNLNRAYLNAPESYLKPPYVRYSKSLLDITRQFLSNKIRDDEFSSQLDTIRKTRDAELIYAAKEERNRRDTDFLRRLGNAGQAYNDSMREQKNPSVQCRSQPDGLGGFKTICN